MTALAAFLTASRICEEEDVPAHLWAYGASLRDGLSALAADHGLADRFVLEGPAVALNYVTRGADGTPSAEMRTLFSQEMIRHGVLMPWISLAQAHGAEELDLTLRAADKAFEIYAKALEDGPAAHLNGPAVKPVFRPTN